LAKEKTLDIEKTIMFTVFTTLLPIFGLILIGYLFNRYKFPGDAFWPLAEKLTYYALFPALLIVKLATANLKGIQILPMMGALLITIMIVSFLLLISRKKLPVKNRAFTSIFQGSIRPNTYVGLAASFTLYGGQGLTMAAVALATIVPLVNLLSVTILIIFTSSTRAGIRKIILSIITNPLILACAIGIGLNFSGIGLPYGTETILDIFSRAALPLGLLSVGVSLDLDSVKSATFPLILSSSMKLLILPILTAMLCKIIGVGHLEASIAVLFNSLPTAASAYILARQLGGDFKLMATVLTVQTVIAVISMPVILSIFG